MNESNIERIENYIKGLLSAQEARDFEVEMENDSALKKSYLMNKELHTAITDKDAREVESILKDISASDKTPTSVQKGSSNRLYLYLGMFFLGLLAAWLVYSNMGKDAPVDNKEMYASYYEPYAPLGINRSQEATIPFEQGLLAYADENYSEAISLFETADLITDKQLFYYGSALLADGKAEQAIEVFSKMDPNGTDWSEQSIWYQALASISLSKNENASTLLKELPATSAYFEKAQKLLKALE